MTTIGRPKSDGLLGLWQRSCGWCAACRFRHERGRPGGRHGLRRWCPGFASAYAAGTPEGSLETPDGKRVHLAPAFSDFQVRGDNGAYQMGPPPGLLLDSFAGSIAGVPRAAGVCPVTIRLEDYDEQAPPVDVVFAVRIEDTPLEIVDVRQIGRAHV